MTPVVGGVAATLLVLALLGREALAVAAPGAGRHRHAGGRHPTAPASTFRRMLGLVAIVAAVVFVAAVAAHLVELS